MKRLCSSEYILNTSQPRAATRGSSEVKVWIWAARLSLKRLDVVAAAATPSLWHLSVLLPQMRKRKGRAEEDTNHGNKKAISSRTPDHQQLWKQKRNENNWAATTWSINTENTNQISIGCYSLVVFLSVCSITGLYSPKNNQVLKLPLCTWLQHH